jgi:hypothetical protein
MLDTLKAGGYEIRDSLGLMVDDPSTSEMLRFDRDVPEASELLLAIPLDAILIILIREPSFGILCDMYPWMLLSELFLDNSLGRSSVNG